MKKPNLNNFGNKLKFKPRVKKQKFLTEKEVFIETIDLFSKTWFRSNDSYEKYKINLLEYEEQFYQIVEGFVLLKYGILKTEIILWFVFARLGVDNKVLPLIHKTEDKTEKIMLNTAEDLWEFLKKLEGDDLETNIQ
jgi:hypothetical protein